jgi:aryl-alcohol dehydrogenase-like predicted oxidoreductase
MESGRERAGGGWREERVERGEGKGRPRTPLTPVSSNTIAAEATTRENVRQSVLESLEKLGSKPDLFLIHNPFVPEEGKIAEFWTYLEELVEDGTLGGVSLGFSNFRPQDIEAVLGVAKIKPTVNRECGGVSGMRAGWEVCRAREALGARRCWSRDASAHRHRHPVPSQG